jgi:hypothetical protein
MLLMTSSDLPEGCCWPDLLKFVVDPLEWWRLLLSCNILPEVCCWPLEWWMLLMASGDLPEGCYWPWSGGDCCWALAVY